MLAVSWFVPLGIPGTTCPGRALTPGYSAFLGLTGAELLTIKEHYRVRLVIEAFSEEEGEFGLGESFSSLVAWGVLLWLLSV